MLHGYKRDKKRFIPPMVHKLKRLDEISYINSIFPEILWIAPILDRFGHHRGIKICVDFAEYARKLLGSDRFVNFAFCSAFKKIKETDKLIYYLKGNRTFSNVCLALKPIVELYDSFPLYFLKEDGFLDNDKSSLEENMKEIVKKIYQ